MDGFSVYLETGQPLGKVERLMDMHCAVRCAAKPTLPLPSSGLVPGWVGWVLVCVAENGGFDAAAVIYDEEELAAFTRPDDRRSRTWLLMPRDEVVRMNPAAEAVLP